MALTTKGAWAPNIFPKQVAVFNDFSRYLLVSGPRKSGKTIAILHRLVRHLWENEARVAFFSKTIKSARDGGVWQDLTTLILPEWIEADIGMEFTTKDGNHNPGPRMDSVTKTVSLKVTNQHGSESEVLLFSLDYDNDVEARVKGTRFSMIYFSELSNFFDRRVFAVTVPQLRLPGRQQWIADCNPSPEGVDSWIYKIFYQERLQANHPHPEFQADISLHEIFCRDNPYFTARDDEELKSLCQHDEELYDRYVNGLWTSGGNQERHFASVYRPNLHVLGDVTSPDKEEWEKILPTPDCIELVAGWDLGEVNHAAVIIEPIIVPGQPTLFAVLDEISYVGQQVSIEEVTAEFLRLMEELEKLKGKQFVWRHWSDPDALRQFRASFGGLSAQLVYASSGERIFLQGVPKEPDSVRRRVQLLKRLLYQNRLFISAHCTATQAMLRELRRGKALQDYVIRTRNPHKHMFDALTYALGMECILELQYPGTPATGVRATRRGVVMAA